VRAARFTWDPEQQPVFTRAGQGFIGDYFGLALTATRTFVLNVSTADLGQNPVGLDVFLTGARGLGLSDLDYKQVSPMKIARTDREQTISKVA
jgi:hypothetical protein